jgi:hypothetical protein
MSHDEGPEVKEWDPEWMVRRGSHIVLVTPELAEEWLLERNTNNRPMQRAAINRYAIEMQAGRWDPDAGSIKFARTGELIDGQNRLAACIKAGVPIPVEVKTGLSLDTKRRIDIGVKRSVAHVFTMERVAYASTIAAAINLRIRYEDAESRGLKLDSSSSSRRLVGSLSPDGALEYLRAHPEHEKVANVSDRLFKAGPGISRSVWFAFMAMAAHADEVDAFKFADEVGGGDMKPRSPVAALWRYLASRASAGVRSGFPKPSLVQERNASDKALTALLIVWNAWRMDEEVDKVVVHDTDPFIPIV